MANSLEKRKYFFIYKTTNLINEKFYIGKHCTSNLKDGYIGSGTILRRSVRKYGKQNFKCEVLEYCENHEDLKKREREIINEEFLKDPLSMNLQLGGGGGFSNEEHIKKCRKGASDHQKKVWQNKEYREKIKKSLLQNLIKNHKEKKIKHDNFKDKTHSRETKALMSEQRKGTGLKETNSQFGTCWITKEGINKKIKKQELNIFTNLGWSKGRE